MMRVDKFRFIGLLILVLLVLPAAAQEDKPPLLASLFSQTVLDERTIQLDLNVLRADGTALRSLSPSNITTTVPSGREPITLATVSAAPLPLDARQPLSLVLVVDLTDSMAINALRSELPIFVRGLSAFPGAELSVIRFTNQVLPERPFASDFDAVASEIAGFNVERVGINSNVVVDAMRTATDVVSRAYTVNPNREYVIVMVTDAVDTVFGNQGAVSEIVLRATNANARLYVIAMPSFGAPPSAPDNELPNQLVGQIGGFAYVFPSDGKLDRDNAALFLGGRIANLQAVLASRFRVVVSLDALHGQGLSGNLPLQLTIKEGESSGIIDTLLDYSETEYRVQFAGLQPNQQVTGQVDLQVQVQPPAAGYQYQFVIDGEEPIVCADPALPACRWDTGVTAPGLRVVGVNVLSGGTTVASTLLPLNVYRTDLNVADLPPYIAGDVSLTVSTSGLAGTGTSQDGADTAILYATLNGRTERVQTQAVGRDSTKITFNVDQLRALAGLGDLASSVSLRLNVELMNQARGLLISRWDSAADIEAVFTPGAFVFTEPAQGVDATGSIPVTLSTRPALPESLPVRYEILVNDQVMPCDQSVPSCLWDTATFLPSPARSGTLINQAAGGMSTLVGRVYVQDTLLAETRPLSMNVYQTDLALLIPQAAVGTVPVTVDTRRYGNAGNLLIFTLTYEGGQVFERTAQVDDSGETIFNLNLDELQAQNPAADGDGTADLTISASLVNNTQNNRLVAISGEQAVSAAYTPAYRVAVTGIESTVIEGDLPLISFDALPTLTVTAGPAPVALLGDQLVLYRLATEGDEHTELARSEKGTLSIPLTAAALNVGMNTFKAAVVRGETVIAESPVVAFNTYRALTGVSILPEANALDTDAFSGTPIIRVNSAGFPDAGVIRVFVDGEQAIPDVAAAQNSNSLVDVAWAVQDLYFSSTSTPDATRTVQLRVDLLDVNGRLLLGRYEQVNVVLRPVTVVSLALSGLSDGDTIYADAPIELTASLAPDLGRQAIYTLALDDPGQGVNTQDHRVIASASSQDSVLRFTPSSVNMQPGLHHLIVSANAVATDAPLLDDATLNVRVVDRLTIQPFGDFHVDPIRGSGALRGKTQLQLLTGANYPGATKLLLSFQPDDAAISAVPLRIVEVTLDQNQPVTADVDWQSQVFTMLNVNQAIPGRLTMEMLDTNNQRVYEFSGVYTLLPDDTLPFYIWLPIIVIAGVFALINLRGTMRAYRLFQIERNQRPPAPGNQANANLTRPVSKDLEGAVLAYYVRKDERDTNIKLFTYLEYMLCLTVGRKVPGTRRQPPPDIMFDSQSVSRHVGRIIMENGEWRFYPEKDQIKRLKANGIPFEQSQHWDKDKHYVRMTADIQISADADNYYLFELMSSQEAMRRLKS